MIRLLTILAILSILAVALPVHAEMFAVGDNDLAAISGKANELDNGASATSITASTANGNIQVGWYQWDDAHSGDASNQKAANFFNSSTAGSNQAQQNVVSNINEINWGAAANSNTVVTSLNATDVDIETWGTLYVGGF